MEETTTPVPETQEQEPQAPEEQQTPAEGIDPELLELVKSLDPETLKNAKNLDDFYKRVNAKSMEAAQLKKQAEELMARVESARTSAPTTADDDDLDDLDPKSKELLRKLIAAEIAPLVGAIVEDRKDTERSIWSDFTAKHDDVPADAIAEKFYELGFDKTANTATKYKQALDKAYKLAKAETADIDAIVSQKLAERLAELKSTGGEVVEVRAKRSEVEPKAARDEDIISDNDIPWFKKMDLFNK